MNEDKGSGGTPPEEEPHTVKPGTEGAAVGANSDEERTVIAPAAAGDEVRVGFAGDLSDHRRCCFTRPDDE